MRGWNVVRTLRRVDITGPQGRVYCQNRHLHAGDVVTAERDDYFRFQLHALQPPPGGAFPTGTKTPVLPHILAQKQSLCAKPRRRGTLGKIFEAVSLVFL